MDDVKWIKLFLAARKGRSMKQIKALPDGKSIALFWYEIMQLAGECNDNGFLYLEQDFPYTNATLAVEFDYEESFVKYAIQVFKQFKMVEQIDDVYMLSNWGKYQNIDGLDKIRLQNSKRQAKHRKKLKELNSPISEQIECKKDSNVTDNVTRNADVTPSNAIERRKKKEDIDIIINNNKEFFVEDLIVNRGIEEFIEFRKSIKSPMTKRAIQLLINKLDVLTEKSLDPRTEKIEILHQSILSGWKGIFPVNKNNFINSKIKKEIAVPSWYPDYEKQLKGEYKREEATPEELEELGKLVKEIME